MKIKVPKLIVKAMQRKNHGSCSDSNADDQSKKRKKKNKRRKWASTPRKLKRVGMIFSNVFSYKKSSSENKGWPSNDVGNYSRSVSVHDYNGENFVESKYEREKEYFFETDDLGSVKTSSSSGSNLQIFVDQPISKSFSLKEILKIEDDRQGKKKIRSLTGRSSLKSSLSFSSFFNKRTSFNFNKGNINKARASSVDGGIGSASFSTIGKQENSCNLDRINELRKLRKGKFTGKKSKKRVEEEHREKEGDEIEDTGDDELCKKRILMGEKCKPLNASGALHYDKNGVLLPEQVIQ